MLESLARRRRGLRLGVLLHGRRAVEDVGGPPPGSRRVVAAALPATPVSDLLIGRLSGGEVAAALDAMPPAHRAAVADAGGRITHPHRFLAYTVAADPPGIVARLGLRTAMPPAEVHHLGEGPEAAGGDFWAADHVADALAATGAPIAPGARILDFGASSGRVVRVLQSAYPGARWFACDPIPGAVAWSAEHLPQVAWSVSPLRPPLDASGGVFDAAYAWSIWSHFGAGPARAWLAEMHRVIRPGGHLVLTVHGWQTLHTWSVRRAWPPSDLRRLLAELYRDGFAYRDVFGPEGDGGVPQEDWGNAFMTLEWLAAAVCPAWSVRSFGAGRVDDVQDLVVLRREP